jgi:hypothetical protein
MFTQLPKVLIFALAFLAVFTVLTQASQAADTFQSAYTVSEGESLWVRTSLPAPATFDSMTFFWSINWWNSGNYKVQYIVYRPRNEYGQIFPTWVVDLKQFRNDEVIVEFKVVEGSLKFWDSCYVFDQGRFGGINERVPHSFYFGFYHANPDFTSNVVNYMPGEVLQSEPLHGDPLFTHGPEYIQSMNIRSDFVKGIEMSVDIKPGSYPNPINPSSNGVIPVALLGKPEFFPEHLDPESVRLEGVPALRYHYADEYTYSSDCDCAIPGSDGYNDMILHFDSAAIAEYLKHTGYKKNQDLLVSATFYWITFMGKDTIKLVPSHK